MRDEIAASSQVHAEGGDVKCARALVLKFAMLYHRSFAEGELHNRIRKISHLAGAGIAFEDRRLAAFLGHDQVAWMRSGAGLLPGRKEKQVNGRSEALAS